MYHQRLLFKHPCYFCDLTEGNNLTAFIIAEVGIENAHQLIIEIRGNAAAIRKACTHIKRTYPTYNLTTIWKQKRKHIIKLLIPQQHDLGGKRPVVNVAEKTGCLFNRMVGIPHKGAQGWEFLKVYARTKTGLKKFAAELERIGEVTIGSPIQKTHFPTASDYLSVLLQDAEKCTLTEKQEKLVEIAHKHGFYTYPRKTSIVKLAKNQLRNPKTVQEMIRKAEQKIVTAYLLSKS
ncbi:MAG: helix-turn-helix domain-containing protein [Candidatus Woesearchaeota archaeon]|nr:helix-turn-helix domain-containing protein [Candidatus Woesearchaeota archaeon]